MMTTIESVEESYSILHLFSALVHMKCRLWVALFWHLAGTGTSAKAAGS